MKSVETETIGIFFQMKKYNAKLQGLQKKRAYLPCPKQKQNKTNEQKCDSESDPTEIEIQKSLKK